MNSSLKGKAAKLAALILALVCGLTACGQGDTTSSGSASETTGGTGPTAGQTVSASSLPESTGEASSGKEDGVIVTVFQTGKSDCILLELNGASVLIDAADKGDGDDIADILKSRGITRLDLLLLTHLDKDHIGGAAAMLENFEIGWLVQADYDEDSKQYRNYEEAQRLYGVTPVRLKEPMEMELGGARLVLTPGAYPPHEEDNDYSIMTEMTYGSTRFLFAGDAEETRLSEFMMTGEGGYDFLKVPHHGRYNPLSDAFFTIVMPKIAVITCSDKEPAEEEVLESLERLGARLCLTSNGTVTVHSDGKTVSLG